ncbi:MAG: hypothetical protein WC379_15340 [Methanoregula sp.]|jgi:hypothetical protein
MTSAIEDILTAITPLREHFYHHLLSYNYRNGGISLSMAAVKSDIWGWSIRFHPDEHNVMRVYFSMNNIGRFEPDQKKRMRIPYSVSIPGEAVFRILNIPYPPVRNDYAGDVHALSVLIHENFARIQEAFSADRIETTYRMLEPSIVTNQDEINREFPPMTSFGS